MEQIWCVHKPSCITYWNAMLKKTVSFSRIKIDIFCTKLVDYFLMKVKISDFIFSWPCISLQILANNQLDALFHVFISSLYMFRASQCSSSGDRIVLIHHMVWLVCVSDCLVCRSGGRHTKQSHRLTIPDDVLLQFDLLMMSTVVLETCREMK